MEATGRIRLRVEHLISKPARALQISGFPGSSIGVKQCDPRINLVNKKSGNVGLAIVIMTHAATGSAAIVPKELQRAQRAISATGSL
jgi:hypothetical protein